MITFTIILFFLGSIFGSFLNACIYRFPRNITLIEPKHSFCPACQQQIKWYDLIPLFSFLYLKGRCRFCSQRINPRYFLVELLSGFIFSYLFLQSFSFKHLIFSFEAFFLIGIFFADLETNIIPDEFSISGLLLGFTYSIYRGQFAASIIACALGGGIFWLISKIGKLIYKKEALGGGDIKLIMMLGSFLWPIKTIIAIYFAFIIGSIIALLLIFLKKKSRQDYMPFGPAIVLAGFIVMLWGDQLKELLIKFL
ncbi:MAG: prepilin peptidase [Candidatus Margulisbacteria bacterium]|nr:prepilin peptidase [Candidatus Margulisiibacteriota bacterium]